MATREKKKRIFIQKLIYTLGIIFLYTVGRRIPLYGIDTSAYRNTTTINAQEMLMQSIVGDRNQSSVFALGISPYMLASMLVMVIVSLRNADSKAKISQKKVNKITIAICLIMASLQAVIRSVSLDYAKADTSVVFLRGITSLEMIAGAMIILWLCDRNKKYGIGGQTALIYVNVLDSALTMLVNAGMGAIKEAFLIAIFMMIIGIVMENAEKRIPLQRISIHNIYADKNYLAIKLNPIGVMPIMFSATVFMIPQLLVTAFCYMLPNSQKLMWMKENLTVTKPMGIVVYIVIIYLLTVGFSIIFVSPRDITEQFLKNGDSIVDLHAGKETRRYLMRSVVRISLFSATIMSLCMGIPMILLTKGVIRSAVAMFPSSVMMLTGIWCSLEREACAIKSYEAYRPFI